MKALARGAIDAVRGRVKPHRYKLEKKYSRKSRTIFGVTVK